MNWKQLHTSATPEERAETAALLLQAAQARPRKWVITYGRRARNRRGAFRGAHFINDKRRGIRIQHPSPQQAGMLLIASILNLGMWMFALPYVPQVAAPIVAVHIIGLGLLFAFHPMPRPAQQPSALSPLARPL